MSGRLKVVLLAMLVLVGAMGLKTAVVSHGGGAPVTVANGTGIPPLPPQ